TVILIPARLASTRIPRKPLADIEGSPMIVHVAQRARESGAGRVVVATDSGEIAEVVEARGFEAVMTSAEHESGSDRVLEALRRIDPDGSVDTIINLQGDLPTIEAAAVQAVLRPLERPEVDI